MAYTDTRQNWSQRDQRRNVRLTDQWGRQYHACIELKSGGTCGLVQPLYTSILPVPMMYLERSRDELRPYDVYVNVDRWITDIRRERKEWDERGRKLSARKYGPEYDARNGFSQDVLEALGPAPQAVEPVLALRQGNSWMLGKTKTPDPRLVQYFAPEDLDPKHLDSLEPDFRDEGLFDDAGTALEIPDYSAEEGEKEEWDQNLAAGRRDIADVLESKAERRARLIAELEALDEIGADPLGTEERADPRAVGGKTIPIVTQKQRSENPEAIRKRAERDRKKQEREQAGTAQQAGRDLEQKRLDEQEQEVINRVKAGEKAARPAIEREILGDADRELLETSIAG